MSERVPASFYARGTVDVARDLLGCVLVHTHPGGTRRGVITETEAYVGIDDRACHAARGGRNGRARVMYGPPGTVYVYRIYGLHWCVNIVTERADFPAAVLIRAVLPIDVPSARATGPGLVCRYMCIDGSANGSDVLAGPLSIEPASRLYDVEIATGRRVGVDYAGEWAERPWRFWLPIDRGAIT